MAWIESHQHLADHPKTRKLARILDISKPTTIGHLHCLWWWALDYADDGILSDFDTLDIAIGAEWEGDPDQFVSALTRAGFVDDIDGVLSIHDWEDYAGKLVNRRRKNAKRMRDARASDNADEIDSDETRASHVQRTQRARAELPDQTGPDQPDKTEKTDQKSAIDQRFDEFWAHYPRKEAKGAAKKAWARIKPSAELTARMIAALEVQKRSEKWREKNGQFIPHPATWLNAERWEDQPSVEIPTLHRLVV